MNLYLCIDNERSSRAGSLGDAWSVDSHLPYNIYKGPHDLVDEMICLCDILYLSLYYYEKPINIYYSSPLQYGDLTYDLSTITM